MFTMSRQPRTATRIVTELYQATQVQIKICQNVRIVPEPVPREFPPEPPQEALDREPNKLAFSGHETSLPHCILSQRRGRLAGRDENDHQYLYRARLVCRIRDKAGRVFP